MTDEKRKIPNANPILLSNKEITIFMFELLPRYE